MEEERRAAECRNEPGGFLKILHIVGDLSLESGGLAVAVLGLSETQAGLGHSVAIMSTDYNREKSLQAKDVDIHRCVCQWPAWRWSGGFKRLALPLIRYADIVHLHAVWDYPVLAGARLCEKLNKPFLWTPHGMMDQWSMAQKSWKKKLYLTCLAAPLFRGARGVHFTSDRERDGFRIGNFNGKVFISAFGVSSSMTERLPLASAFGERFLELKSRRVILYLGRLHYKKKPDVLINAFAKIAKDYPRLCLVIAGSGDPSYVSSLREYVNRLKLNDDVFFKGMLTGMAVQEAYAAAEIFVLPSLQENFGFSIMEAMASGCAVVVGEGVDYASEIAKTGSGLVCSSTPESVADALKRLLESPELRQEMGRKGRSLVMEKFGWQEAAARFITHYESLLAH